jgi:hypothetical protein
VTGSSARILVIGGGRFAHHFSERLAALDPTAHITRLQRSQPGQPSSASIGIIVNSEFPVQWLATQVMDGGYDVVVLANSAVSPYSTGDPGGWASLQARLPFGLTAPLQTKYLLPIAEIVRDLGSRRPVLINACYPDVTNQLAAMLGQPPDWGLGNGQALASFLSPPEHPEIVAVAHHWHLHRPPDETLELMAWSADGVAQEGLGTKLHAFRSMSKQDRNRRAAREAANQVGRALHGKVVLSSVTAPPGFGGTVPCLLRGFAVDNLVDTYCGATQAKALLADWTRREGLAVDPRTRTIEFVGPVRQFYQSMFGTSVYSIDDWPQLTAQLEHLATRQDTVPTLAGVGRHE